MLSREEDNGAVSEAPPLRVCTICDGIDALLRMAAWVVTLPAGTSRTDLTLAEALDHLGHSGETGFDIIVLAPDAAKPAAPKLVNAVLETASDLCRELIVLLAPGSGISLAPQPGLRLVFGPPFDSPSPPSDKGEALPEDPAPASPKRRPLLPWRRKPVSPVAPTGAAGPAPPPCRVMAFQPLSGGCGSTTLAVNLAFELTRLKPALNVCLLDLNLQFGGVGTYLDLAAGSRVLDAYRNLRAMDAEAFQSCLQRLSDQLTVFPAPAEILPLDALSAADLRRLLALARDAADLVLLDLPHLVTDWSETAFAEADCIYAVSTPDVRSAQNAAKLGELMRGERLADGKLFHLLNRAPQKPGKDWEAEKAGFEKGLGMAFLRTLPDGGSEVGHACNAGSPLWREAAANPLRTALLAFAEDLLPGIGRHPRAASAEAG